MTKKSIYLLKAGVILMIPGDSNIYNNFNLTDEVAEMFLKNNPKAIGKFQAYPEDWKNRIEEKQPETVKKQKKEKQPETVKTESTE